MATSFLDSLLKASAIIHQQENDAAVQQAQQTQQMMQMMQMRKMAQEMGAIDEARKAYGDVETPGKFSGPQMEDKYGLTSGEFTQQYTPSTKGPSPAMQSALSMLPPGLHAAAKVSLQRTGELPKWFPKLGSEDMVKVVDGQIVQRGSDGNWKSVFGEPKSENRKFEMKGLDPKTNEPVFYDPNTQSLVTQNGQRYDYSRGQLKSTTEPAQIFQVIPGYQTPSGQPAKTSLRTPDVPPDLQKTPSEADIKEARTFTGVSAVIDEIDRAFKEAERALPKDEVDRVVGYAGRVAAVKTQTDPKLVTANAMAESFLAKFARAAGEVGTLTDQDVARAKPLVYSIHDTPAVRQDKSDKLKALYREIFERGKRQENPLGPNNPVGTAGVIPSKSKAGTPANPAIPTKEPDKMSVNQFEAWNLIQRAGTSSRAVKYLTDQGYDEGTAKAIVRRGIAEGKLK
jgi:hypothetical protein